MKSVGYTFLNNKGYSYIKVFKKTLKNGKIKKVDRVGRTVKTRIYKTKIIANKESNKRFKRLSNKHPGLKKQKFRL